MTDTTIQSKLKMRALHDSVIFQFLEDTGEGQFLNQKTRNGIIIPRCIDSNGSKPRWGVALLVGPKCTEIKVGDYIFIEPLRWTVAVEVDGMKVWRTVEKDVIAISDEVPTPEF